MVLRAAEVTRAYAKLGKRAYSPAPTEAELLGLSDDGTITRTTIELSPGVTIIAGGNGAGKSTVLRSLHAAIAGEWRDADRGAITRVRGALIYGGSSTATTDERWGRRALREGFGAPEWPADVTPAADEPEVVFIDAARETESIVRALEEDEHPEDFLEGVDGALMSDEWRETVARILKRSYDSIEIIEVPSIYGDEESITPYFIATAAGSSYSSLDMGRGELAAIYLIWRIMQLRSGAIALIEEPENHLAAHSQAMLIDTLVARSVADGVTFIVSTHSPEFFRRLPDGHVISVTSNPVLKVRSKRSTHAVAHELGSPRPLGAIAVVEDAAAGYLLSGIIAEIDLSLLDSLHIFFATDGESGVRQATAQLNSRRDFNLHRPKMPVLSVYDGDQRSSASANPEALFLPTDLDPERALMDVCGRWRAGEMELRAVLGEDERLEMSLDAVEGLDPHDWFIELAKLMGGERMLVHTAVPIALSDDEFASQAVALVNAIDARIGSS